MSEDTHISFVLCILYLFVDSDSESEEEEEREPRPQRPTRTQSVRPMSSGPQSRNRTPSRPRSGVRQRGASPANNLIRCSLAVSYIIYSAQTYQLFGKITL